MKRYKLLKDLPTFNKGDTFRLTKRGNLMSEKAGVIAYTESTLEKFNILDNGWFEEIPGDHRRWRAEQYGRYYFVGDSGAVFSIMEDLWAPDDCRYSIGNYFKTGEEAEKAVKWLKALATLRDDTKGFKPDWGDPEQDKWFVSYDHASRRLWSWSDFTHQVKNLYFASEDDADDSIRKHEREWLTFFGVEE